jgi:hypothetical protein
LNLINYGWNLNLLTKIKNKVNGGKITCKSEVGVGTEFAIALSIKHQHSVELSNNSQLVTNH